MLNSPVVPGLLLLSFLALPLCAQRPAPAGFPVIVVFNDNVRFEDFRGLATPDARSAADPQAWGYLNRGVLGAVRSLERRMNFSADQVYSHALRGFAARLTARQIADLENDAMVSFVEPDGIMTATGKPASSGQVLPWGINRIDADLSSTKAGDGSGEVTNVNVYVIDTGIDASHPDLNVVQHVNFAGGANTDCNGHGTHVSGTIAARDNTADVVGVAPGAPLTGVKVLGCSGSGSTSGVVKGIDWVTANAQKPAVANMSLGGGVSQAIDDAVMNSVGKGVFYAVAAGNDGADACQSSPARVGKNAGVMAVAATDSNDNEASWSNYGSCVDIWAPGVSVLSTKKGGGTTTMSGTSMASPHVAGSAVLYLSKNASSSPSQVENGLSNAALNTHKTGKGGAIITLVNVAVF